jgi:hypothetical protein
MFAFQLGKISQRWKKVHVEAYNLKKESNSSNKCQIYLLAANRGK